MHTMPSVFFAFTLRPFLSIASYHSTTLLCKYSSVSANIPKSSVYSRSHNPPFPTLFLTTSNTATNWKGLSADPWCQPTVTGNSAVPPHSRLTLALALLYISSSNLTICSTFFLNHKLSLFWSLLSNCCFFLAFSHLSLICPTVTIRMTYCMLFL